MKYLFTLFTILLLFSCNENEEQIAIDSNNKILGSWSHATYLENNAITYKRVSGIIDDDYSFTLNNNGNFIEHKNAGSCGTPPISFGDFEGNWLQKENIIYIESKYWGGTQNLNWEIISLTDETLTIKITYTE